MDELLKKLKELGVVQKSIVTLASKNSSNFYINMKKAFGYPQILLALCDRIGPYIDKSTTCIASMGYGGIPPCTTLSNKHDWKHALIRDIPKQHGLGLLIEGHMPTPEDRVAVFDDVFTTGGSIRKIISTIQQSGAYIVGAYAFVKRGEGNLDIPLHYIFTAGELLGNE